jgi:hypothetical protein
LFVQVLRLLAIASVLAIVVAPATLVLTPAAALAQQMPTKQQLETAVKAADPTIGQLRQLRKLEPNINNMTPAQFQQAIAQIFTPNQLARIRQSLQAQGVTLPGH